MNKLLSIIANPSVDKQTLMETIQKLGEVTESAQFWADIINSDEYSKDHRRRAVFQLFQRFVSPGMTLFALDVITPDYDHFDPDYSKALEINAQPVWLHHTFSEKRQHDLARLILKNLFS